MVTVTALVLWVLVGSGPECEQAVDGELEAPILLVHGLGESAADWNESGYVAYLEGLGLRNGGVVRGTKGRAVIRGGRAERAEADVFVFEVSEPFASLDLWQAELRAAVLGVTEWTGLPRVILLGFSAGGVAARKYLVEHPSDHRVARLVTVSSPHAGSELALAAELLTEGGAQPLMRWAQDVMEARGMESSIHPDAALVRELLPPRDGNVLDVLNRLPHPQDVDYACVIATGTEVSQDWRTLQAAVAETRAGNKSSSFFELLSTALMRTLASFTANRSQAGDGAVLVASQHLGRVEFFRRHPELVLKTLQVPGGHGAVKQRYRALTEAVADSVEFLRARPGRNGEEPTVQVDFRSPLAALSEVTAADESGRDLKTGTPSLHRCGDQIFARVEVGPLPDPDEEIELRVRPPQAPTPYGAVIRPSGAGVPPHRLGPGDYQLTVWGALGTAAKDWDPSLAGVGAGADLEMVLSVDGEEVLRTRTMQDVGDVVLLEDATTVRLDPRSSRVELALWDMDLKVVPEPMGTVVWNPGQLVPGRGLFATREPPDERILVDLELRSSAPGATRWARKPLSW